MRHQLHKIVTIGLALTISHCRNDRGSVDFNIVAKSADGKPVAGAIVTLDSHEIGQTNAFGTFSIKTEVSSRKRHKITVAKEDPGHYYAPHFETFKLNPGESKSISITPVMYTVPKPQRKSRSIANLERVTPPAPAEPRVNQEDVSSLAQPKIPLVMFRASDLVPAEKVPITLQPKPYIFTTHVYSGRLPVGDALVTWLRADGKESQCRTNDRGRCVINTDVSDQKNGYILIQRENFKSKLQSLSPGENSNHRFSLEAGNTVEIRTVEAGPWKSKPLPDVEISHDGITQARTNEAGIAVVPIMDQFPLTLKLSSQKSNVSYEMIVKSVKNPKSIFEAKFSDHSNDGWAHWTLYPVHLEKNQSAGLELVNFEKIESALNHNIVADKSGLDPKDFRKIPGDTVSILPVLKRSENALEFGLIALGQEGELASSGFFPVSASAQSESWGKTVTLAIKNLKAQLPWPGTVTQAIRQEARVAINTTHVKPRDTVVIETPSGPLTTTVKNITGNEAVVIIPTDFSVRDGQSWTLIGSPARKLATMPSTKLPSFTFGKDELISRTNDTPSLRLAKKFIAEGNPDKAISQLAQGTDGAPPTLEELQMLAVIESGRRNSGAVINILHKMMETSGELGMTRAAIIAEINLMIIQIESAPGINGDQTVADRFKEIGARAESLLVELGKNDADQYFDLALRYVKLAALQKEAESRDDVITLATLTAAWEDFERSIAGNENHLIDVESWKTSVQMKKSKVAFKSTPEKTSM